LEQCFTVNDSGLSHLVKGCKNLRVISLGSSTQITEDGIAHALLALPNLVRFGRVDLMMLSAMKIVQVLMSK
jgi:hypothetical protein